MSEDNNHNVHTKKIESKASVGQNPFPTVHVDKAMVAVDHGTNTVTLTMLAMHMIPKIGSEGWTLENVNWDVVGELKMTVPVMNALAVYYIDQISNGLNILPFIRKHLQDHPMANSNGVTYGPTDIKQEQK